MGKAMFGLKIQKYVVKELLNIKFSHELYPPNPLRIVVREELFDLFERVHSEGGRHLGRDLLFAKLKSQYAGFSRDPEIVMVFVKTCQECQLQKCRKSLQSIVTHQIRSNEFVSRGQVDPIDFQGQAVNKVNLPYKFLLVYKDHLQG